MFWGILNGDWGGGGELNVSWGKVDFSTPRQSCSAGTSPNRRLFSNNVSYMKDTNDIINVKAYQ